MQTVPCRQRSWCRTWCMRIWQRPSAGWPRRSGFREHFRYGQPISGAQMLLGAACVMVHGTRPGSASPSAIGCRTSSLTVLLDDVDAHFERAKTAGAKIVEEPHETVYGREFQYAAEDPEGHLWIFGATRATWVPREWGATVTYSPEA